MPLLYPIRGDVTGPDTGVTDRTVPIFDQDGKHVGVTGINVDLNNNLWGNGHKFEVTASTSITLDITHKGKIIWTTAATPVTVTLVDFSVDPQLTQGFNCVIVQGGTGVVTVTAPATDGVTTLDGATLETSGLSSNLALSKDQDTNWWILPSTSGGSNTLDATFELVDAQASYTLTYADNGKILWFTNSDAGTDVVLNDIATDPELVQGFNCIIVQGDAGALTVSQQISAADTLVAEDPAPNTSSLGQSISLAKAFASTWWVVGGGPSANIATTPTDTTVGEVAIYGDLVGDSFNNSPLRVDSSGNFSGNGALVKVVADPTYTLLESDCGKFLHFTNVGGCTVTAPGPTALPYASNIQCVLVQKAAGAITVAGDGESTVHASGNLVSSAGLDAELALYRYSATDYQLGGERA